MDLYPRFETELLRVTGGEALPVTAALSGGSDSVAMLHLLCRFREKNGRSIFALHVHHGLRGPEADRDAEFCAKLCVRWKVPFEAVHVDVNGYAEEHKKGIEESARVLRYEALEREREKNGGFVATAHNADDRLETVLFRVARGSGLAGLSGIPERRGQIVRPMLSFTKEEIERYLADVGETFVFDSTNGEDCCTRNRIRHEVVPVLREVCPGTAENVARLCRNAEEDERFLCSLLPEGSLDAKELENLPAPLLKRYAARAYADYRDATGRKGSLECVHTDAICALVAEKKYGKTLSLPGGIRVVFDLAGLHFSPDRRASEDWLLTLLPGENRIPCSECSIYVINGRTFAEICKKDTKIHSLFMITAVNCDTITEPLYARPKKEGDRAVIGGMTKRVRNLVAEVCAETEKRKTYPVILDSAGVLLVPGHPARDCSRAEPTDDAKDGILVFMMGEAGYELP